MISIDRTENKKLNILAGLIFFAVITVFFILQYYKGELISDDIVYLNEKFTSFGEAFHYVLHYGNGRLLGNILGIGLSYFLQFRLIFKAVCSSLIVMLTPYVLNCDNLVSYALSFIAFGSISSDMYRMTIEFNSAYANYCPPILAMLLCILLVKSYYNNSKRTPLIFTLLFIVSLLGQLFVENSSILNICIPLLMIFAMNYRKKSTKPFTIWLIGSTVGVWAMFMIPVVFEPSSNLVSQYRSLNLSSFSKFITSISNALIDYLRWFDIDYFIIFLIFISMFILLIENKKISKNGKASLITINLIGIIYFIAKVFFNFPYFNLLKKGYNLNAFVNSSSLLLLIATLITIVTLTIKSEKKEIWGVFIIILFAAFAPLSIIHPLRISCFMHIYVILTGLCICIINRSEKVKKFLSLKADIISAVITLAFSISKLSGLYIG